jgi:uracil-DNA glycosylase family 4
VSRRRVPERSEPARIPPASAAGSGLLAVHQQIVTCERCPRLRAYCTRIAREKRASHSEDTYWGRPVPGFGDPRARVLVLGLAPAAHGANRTGRVFTGDGSGDFLMRAMHACGLASIPTSRHAGDGLMLSGAYIAAAVRCAPPANKPMPAEIANCERHLEAEIHELSDVRVVVALGRIASEAYWRLVRRRGVAPRPRPAFSHGATFAPETARVPALVCSYHPSRQNTNTRKLTPPMLEAAFRTALTLAASRRPHGS